MAMSLLATHLKLNRDGETFFIGGKVPQPNQESLISRIAHRAKRIAAASASLSKVLPDRRVIIVLSESKNAPL
jgi:acyl-CoA synthetase (AMP-forming)/AMP-acid ligase II